MYIEIKNDVFNIANRIKSLDKNYIIKYNLNQKRFEVWYKENAFVEHLEIVVPYPCLDVRTIYKVANSKTQELEKIIKELNLSNNKIKEDAKQNLLEELDFKVKTILS